MIPQGAVVTHVGICHEEVAVADDRLATALDGASVQGDTLADDVMIADKERRFFPLVDHRLGTLSNGGKLKNLAFCPDSGPPANKDVRSYPGSLAYHHVFLDDRVRTDLDPLA